MKAKLLKKLRKAVLDNSDLEMTSPFGGFLVTWLDGEKYVGSRHSTIGFNINAEEIGRELEHIAIEDYVKKKRNR